MRWIINDYLAIVLNAFPLRERGRAMAIFFAVALVAMPGGKVEERVAEDPEPSQATPGVA